MVEADLVTFVAAMFSMMNPIGGVAIFASMTADRDAKESKRIAWTCAFACVVTLLIATWSGSLVLRFFGIGVNELRTAGAIIVLIIGLNMLFNNEEHRQTESEAKAAQNRDSIAVVPLAIPIVAGAGTIATVLVAADHHPGIAARAMMSLAIVALCVLTGWIFAYSKLIAQWLGESGIAVVTRVMGMILAAIAVGMFVSGLKGLFPALA